LNLRDGGTYFDSWFCGLAEEEWRKVIAEVYALVEEVLRSVASVKVMLG
jgi:hypothetical protein